ncbi:hypothetical protein SPBR_08004 [Sporothrix brasiliensis 5110]|uniref:Uncharacterized protein n=1 Tax=Sporothrix brasiliensis 5110 TaxID=1398154 RepID=A0A0C2FAU7_9PEZI|nr:uncharacterized protein SPBR_08004 [Sporothrix brasiliensis 5110]KIH88183.1 hypothetical protein SPBR_08004 [Sporothrix brasiliensis 5110]
MCTIWFHITYCETCNGYIDSHLVGTVFCGRRDQDLPCEVEKAIGETAVPGPAMKSPEGETDAEGAEGADADDKDGDISKGKSDAGIPFAA